MREGVRARRASGGRLGAAGLALLAGLGLGSLGRADGIIDLYPDSSAPFSTYDVLFPNWLKAPAATFLVYEDLDANEPLCTTSAMTGVTIFNYGTATGGAAGDLTALYLDFACAASTSAVFTMTYAGIWNTGGLPTPAWTWAGSYAWPADPCTSCACFASLDVYADVGACPADGATVQLGPAFNIYVPSPGSGGVSDSCGHTGPLETATAPTKTIRYLLKSSSPDNVSPGDTISYTVTYGLPGPTPLANLTITDSLPAYTHYVVGSGTPAPDPGWDPLNGPPLIMRWTLPTPGTTAGGATQQVTFMATADWGNQESFEPGSGDLAAPENSRLYNQAQLSWAPSTCAPGRMSNFAGPVVTRYLFYMIGDNDLLYASSLGTPDDEMIYSVFIKNQSSQKTWWNVSIWDTVPPEIDTWAPGYGFNDPCQGWTMTPSGCSPASPGTVVVAGKTILTWKLDLPAGMTLSLQWKAHVKATVPAGSTALNILSLYEQGRTGVVGGTGAQTNPSNFVHLAPIVLRTTYISYAGIGGSGLGKLGVFITFYPLNKASDFELRGLEYGSAQPWTTNAGLSPTINVLIGTCTGGFSCTSPGGFPGGTAGCKTERIPADYSCWSGGTPGGVPYGTPPPCSGSISPGNPCSNYPAPPYHFVYKLTANSPVLWQLFTCDGNDAHTFAPSTTMSFSGFMHYAFSRVFNPDYFSIVNTSIGPDMALHPGLPTTVHIFAWDFNSLSWVWQESFAVDGESQVMPCPLPVCNAHYRFVSSQAKLIVREGENTWFSSESNWDSFSPSRNAGVLTMNAPGEVMYIFPNMKPGYQDIQAIITNMANTTASFKIEGYVPTNPNGGPACAPPWLSDTSGTWLMRTTGTVGPLVLPPAAGPNMSHIYGTMYDATYTFNEPPSGTAGLWRLTLLGGGPIEINQGARVLSTFGGGSLMHPSVPAGAQAGTEFWLTTGWEWTQGGTDCNAPFQLLYAIDVFCPKTGMTAQALDDQGFSAKYTTTGPDQCVAFERFSPTASGAKRNIHILVTGGNAIAMYNDCQPSHKFFTAPFVQVGVHYSIILPPLAYVGQPFWITVLVVDAGGGTKDDYCGTSSFTSTDPTAKVAGTPMDSYNYTWHSSTGGCLGAPNDNGVAIFVNVSFSTLGLQNIVASDTVDGSITGLAAIMVVGTDVKLTKRPAFSLAASGDTVQFKICWSNYSSNSAFSFVITDAVPQGSAYLPEVPSAMDCGNTDGVALTVAYSTSQVPAPPAAFNAAGASAPPANTQWLRWTIPMTGVGTTGCACFRVVVQ